MFNKQAFESGNKGGCGPMGRGGFGGPRGRGKFGAFWGRHAGGLHQAPVNIDQTDTEFVISLFAAALVKEKVNLAVKDDVLTISYTGPDESATSPTSTYQEYYNPSFERSFQLNDKVLTESISATYTDGVLKVILPKNPATNQPAKTITVV